MMGNKTRALVLRRDSQGQLCLHDEETGLPLAGPAEVSISQSPHEPTAITVKFYASPQLGESVRLEVSDG